MRADSAGRIGEASRVGQHHASLTAAPRRARGGPAGSGAHRGFRADVEGLRAVAVLAVVLFHAGVAPLAGGFVGVDVFFVVSGFLITGLLWDELDRTGRVSLAAFYARRVRRLLPAAVLVLVVTAAAATALLSPLRARTALADVLAAGLYVANYRFALQRTEYLTADAPPSPVQHYWSLGVEEQFYLVWPLLLVAAALVARRRPSRGRAVAALALVGGGSLALSLHLTRADQPWAFFSLPTRAWELAAGGLVALAVPVLRRAPGVLAAPLGWLGLAAVCWSVLRIGETTPFPGTAALGPVLGTAAVLAAGAAAPRLGPVLLLGRAPLRLLGRLSYSWYLWHWPVLVLAPEVAGRPLHLPESLALAAGTGVLAYATLRLVEDPLRFSPGLRAQPRRGLVLGAGLTAAVAAATLAATPLVPVPHGSGAPAAAAQLPPVSRTPGRAPRTGPDPASRRLAAANAPVLAAIRRAVQVEAVPANLAPPVAEAHADKAPPFVDGCHLSYGGTRSPDCEYADHRSRTKIVLYGDSHATQWFPGLERIAETRHWGLVSLTKSTCPPVRIALVSPVLGRAYRECDQWRDASVARIRAERPAVVVLGVARHYNEEYHFSVYSRAWLTGLAATVRTLRASGTAVVVLGPTPKPETDVPDCLSEHLSDATACTTPTSRAVNARGMAAERAATIEAGGTYVDVSRWICTPATCAVVVGDMLVYRDDNHLTTRYPAWLAPVLAAQLDEARRARTR